MKMKCKEEALREDGSKIMNFTKGKVYEFTQVEEDVWEANDDNAVLEEFFNPNIMFEEVPF